MSDTYAEFQMRRKGIERKHSALAKGYSAKIGKDGLITLVPRRSRSLLTARMIVGAVICFMVFKSVTLALIGPPTYEERIASLAGGTTYEKAAAWVMQIDPVSATAAEFLQSMMP